MFTFWYPLQAPCPICGHPTLEYYVRRSQEISYDNIEMHCKNCDALSWIDEDELQNFM